MDTEQGRYSEEMVDRKILKEDVSLLDLTGKWPTRAKASASINSGPRPRCQRWSRAIYDAYPDLMGLASTMNGMEPAVVPYEMVSNTLPRLPIFNRPLSDAPVLTPLERIAADLGYDLI